MHVVFYTIYPKWIVTSGFKQISYMSMNSVKIFFLNTNTRVFYMKNEM